MKKLIILIVLITAFGTCLINASVLEDILHDYTAPTAQKGPMVVGVAAVPYSFYLALDVFEHYGKGKDTAQAEEDLEYFSYNAIASLRHLRVSVQLTWCDPNSSSGILVRNSTKGNYASKKEALQSLLETGLYPVWLRVGEKITVPRTVNSFINSLPKKRKWSAFLSPFTKNSDEKI